MWGLDLARASGHPDLRVRQGRYVFLLLSAAALQMVISSGADARQEHRSLDIAAGELVGTAEVRNEKVLRSRPFQKVGDAECRDNYCTLVLKRLGSRKRLLVRNVSCRIHSSIASEPVGVGLLAESNLEGGHAEFYVPTVISGSAADETWTFNQQTKFYAFPGAAVVLYSFFDLGSLDAMTCAVSGALQTVE